MELLIPLALLVGAAVGFIIGRLTAKPASTNSGTVATPKLSPGEGGTPR